MSTTKWEYAQVSWTGELRKITRSSPEYPKLPEKVRREGDSKDWQYFFWQTQKISIRLPGTDKAEERVSWETGDEKPRVALIDVHNELGADGWELVDIGVRGHGMGSSHGRQTTSFPISTSAWFKRPVGTE